MGRAYRMGAHGGDTRDSFGGIELQARELSERGLRALH